MQLLFIPVFCLAFLTNQCQAQQINKKDSIIYYDGTLRKVTTNKNQSKIPLFKIEVPKSGSKEQLMELLNNLNEMLRTTDTAKSSSIYNKIYKGYFKPMEFSWADYNFKSKTLVTTLDACKLTDTSNNGEINIKIKGGISCKEKIILIAPKNLIPGNYNYQPDFQTNYRNTANVNIDSKTFKKFLITLDLESLNKNKAFYMFSIGNLVPMGIEFAKRKKIEVLFELSDLGLLSFNLQTIYDEQWIIHQLEIYGVD